MKIISLTHIYPVYHQYSHGDIPTGLRHTLAENLREVAHVMAANMFGHRQQA